MKLGKYNKFILSQISRKGKEMEVKKNQFTNSSSKQKWSFSKSRRFVEIQTNNAGFYSNPSSLEKKSASFGYGKRINMANEEKKSCDPGAYNITSTFENKNRGFSFGTGRDKSKFQNYLKMLGNSSTNTFYNVNDSNLHKGKAFSIKERTIYPPNYFIPNDPEAMRLSSMPSPFSYNTIDNLGEKGVSSKNKNIGYHFPSARRFSASKAETVGPGAYENQTITADGDYILSNMKSSGRRTIFKGKRTTIFDRKSTIPGPGEYDVIGDFGQIVLKQTINTSTIEDSKLKRPQTARN